MNKQERKRVMDNALSELRSVRTSDLMKRGLTYADAIEEAEHWTLIKELKTLINYYETISNME